MANVVVRFIGEFSNLNKSVGEIESTGSRIKKWAGAAAAAIGTVGAIEFGKKAVEAATQFESAGERINRTFGPASKTIDDFAAHSVQSFGETETAVKNFANQFGTVLTGFGIAQPKAAAMSKTLTTLAANLAARKGVPMSDAVDALTRAVAGGKAQALKTFGISIDNAAIQMEALRSGLVKAPPNMAAVQIAAEKLALAHDKAAIAVKEHGAQSAQARAAFITEQAAQQNLTKQLASGKVTLTAAQKAQAAYNLVTREGANAAGAVGKSLQTTAGQTKQLKAGFEEAQVSVGQILLPVLKAALPILTSMAKLFVQNKSVILPIAGAILGIVVALRAFNTVTKLAETAQRAFTVALKLVELAQKAAAAAGVLFDAAMDANPVVLIVLAVIGLVAGLVLLYQHFAIVREGVALVWSAIQVAFNWIVAHWPLLLVVMFGPFGLLVTVVIKNFSTIVSVISSVISWIVAHWQLLLIILTGPIGLAVVLIVRNFTTVKNAVVSVWQAVVLAWGLITTVLSTALHTWGAVLNALGNAFLAIGKAALNAYNTVASWIGKIPGLLLGIINDVARAAAGIANAIIGPINTVIQAWNDLQFPAVHFSLGPVHFDSAPIGLPDIPKIPRLAEGGIVQRATLALIAETGPEAVVPLRSGLGNTYNINVNVAPGVDPVTTGRTLVDLIKTYERASGRSAIGGAA